MASDASGKTTLMDVRPGVFLTPGGLLPPLVFRTIMEFPRMAGLPAK